MIFYSRLIACGVAAFASLAAALPASALTAAFNSSSDVPVTAASYLATGETLDVTLNFAPSPGNSLTVVNNTGIDFIHGTFANLAQGQPLTLSFAGTSYRFIANYYGGTGNDLVLLWAETRLIAWGSNANGQAGNNSTVTGPVPMPVDMTGVLAGKTITAISSGGEHSLVLCSDGTLAAWGYNHYGELGNSSTTDSSAPVLVNTSGVLAGKTSVAITTGLDHNIALCSDGTLVSWGYNNFNGSLGNNSLINSPTPVEVDRTGALNGKSVVAISAGVLHTLALCSDGTVACWGAGGFGQLGNDAITNALVPVLPETTGVLAGKSVIAIAAGRVHSMVLCSDGTLVAWGNNDFGQLGDGTTTTRRVPVTVSMTGALAGKTVVAISAGGFHSHALCSDGSIASWGDNGYGELGNNSTTSSSLPVAVDRTGVLAGKTVTSLSTGDEYALAHCSDGTVAAWGYNGFRQLGNNSTLNSSIPVAVSTADLMEFEQIAFTAAGSGSRHSLGIVTTAPTPVTGGPEIEVEQPVGRTLDSGSALIDFGTLLLKTTTTLTFTIRNTGDQPLTGIATSITGVQASQYTVTSAPATTVEALGSTTFVIQAKATDTGIKNATLHISSNDADEPVFDISLTAKGAVAVAPLVTTGTATAIDFDPAGVDIAAARATLNGTVNAKGSPRQTFFDFGTSTAYDTRFSAEPASVDGVAVAPVSRALTGLQPHQLYHYRLVAIGALGSAIGTDKTFTTPNRAPVGNPDNQAIVLPGGSVIIDVINNDTDPDGDTLKITATTAVTPRIAGKVTITANKLLFTASSSFSGAQFGYTLSDRFGGTSTASVNISAGTCSLDPDMNSIPSAGTQYPIHVTATGAWAASKSATWISISPAQGTGDDTVQVTLSPNPGTASRTGTVTIGGVSHTVTQAGVLKPVLNPLPETSFNTIVSAEFTLQIPTQNAPVSYTLTGLPPGLRMDHATGILAGRPIQAGDFPVTVRAANAKGKSDQTLSFTIHVAALPTGTVGLFHGWIARSETVCISQPANLGARIELTTTRSGVVTGKIFDGVTTRSFRTALQITLATQNQPVVTTSIPGTTLALNLTLDHDSSALAGILSLPGQAATAEVKAWRNAWSSTAPVNKATRFKARHHFSIENMDATGPQGFGYGAFVVNEATGALTIIGRLADNSALLCATFIGQAGQVLLHQPLYSKRGSLIGQLTITPGPQAPADNTLAGDFTWLKLPPPGAAPDASSLTDFGPLSLHITGGTYLPPGPGLRILGLPPVIAPATNATLAFSLGGLEAAAQQFTQPVRIANPGTKSLTNTAAIAADNASGNPNPNPNRVSMTTLTASTGIFGGSFILPGATPALNRSATYTGQVVPTPTEPRGFGFFLLPQSQTSGTAPKLSGRVQLQAP